MISPFAYMDSLKDDTEAESTGVDIL